MNKAELNALLRQGGFNPQTYSLEGGLPADKLVLSENYGKWSVYYSERGGKSGEKVFDSEDAACRYFLERMRNDPTTH